MAAVTGEPSNMVDKVHKAQKIHKFNALNWERLGQINAAQLIDCFAIGVRFAWVTARSCTYKAGYPFVPAKLTTGGSLP